MKRDDALPGKYLAQSDFESPKLLTIREVKMEGVRKEDREEHLPIIYFEESERGVVLNGTNWDIIEASTGESDSDNWVGHKIVGYCDPNVMFGRKKVGGIRFRAPKLVGKPSRPNPAERNDEIPF